MNFMILTFVTGVKWNAVESQFGTGILLDLNISYIYIYTNEVVLMLYRMGFIALKWDR